MSLREDIGVHELEVQAQLLPSAPWEVRHLISFVAIIILAPISLLNMETPGKQREVSESGHLQDAILMKTKGWGLWGGCVLT